MKEKPLRVKEAITWILRAQKAKPGRRVCTNCNRGKTHYVCCGCGKWYHVGCFAVAHGVTGVVEADVEEESEEAEEDGSEREDSEDDTEQESEEEGEEDEEEETEEEEESDGEEDEDMEDDEDQEGEGGGGRAWWNRGLHGRQASAIPTHGTSANPGGQPRRLDTQTVRTSPPKVRACAIVTCYAFCACRKPASKSTSQTPCCAFCEFCA